MRRIGGFGLPLEGVVRKNSIRAKVLRIFQLERTPELECKQEASTVVARTYCLSFGRMKGKTRSRETSSAITAAKAGPILRGLHVLLCGVTRVIRWPYAAVRSVVDVWA